METNAFLDQLQQQTEVVLDLAIRQWQLIPPQDLAQVPEPGRWSAAQCLAHLNVYGNFYLPAIEKGILQGQKTGSSPARIFQSGFLGAYFTKIMQPDSKTKMKSPANAVPSTIVDPVQTLAQFIDQQERLLTLIDQARTVNLNQVRIPISIAPWILLKLGDTFGFYTAHQLRHVQQAERALMG
jgi:hypothetical protein